MPSYPNILAILEEYTKTSDPFWDMVGVVDAASYSAEQSEYDAWIQSGFHGGMEYLKRHAPMKFNPERLLPDCASILFFGMNYLPPMPFLQPSPSAASEGRVSRYAWAKDYHKVLKKGLEVVLAVLRRRYPTAKFYTGVDSTPLAEKFYACKAGLGTIGRNTLLIHPEFGSWFVFGEILSSQRFESMSCSGVVDKKLQIPNAATNVPPACIGCDRCLNICPVHALSEPYRLDASRCISYLTIEHKGTIPEELRPGMGNWLFGCDLCQEVCPINQNTPTTTHPEFLRNRNGPTQRLQDVLSFQTDVQFQERYAGTPVVRAKRQGLIRNACIVAANNHATELIPMLEYHSKSTDKVIAEHAEWALKRLLR